jgi:glycerol-3-phosphate dehydrogenase
LVVGPTAEDCDERDLPSLSSDVTSRLVEYGQRIIPALSRHSVVAVYGGLRPATETKDYRVYVNTERYLESLSL